MSSRPGKSRRQRGGTLKPQLPQIELLDEGLDHAHRVVVGHIIVQARRQQRSLASILAFNESLHAAGLAKRVAEVYEDTLRFYTASAERSHVFECGSTITTSRDGKSLVRSLLGKPIR